jgi:hypothetical protein
MSRTNNVDLDALDNLATEIGAAGAAEDGAVGVLAKAVSDLGSGVTDALKDALAVLRMEKGEGVNTPKPAHTKPSSMSKADGEDDPDTVADDHLSEDRGGSPDEDEGGAGYEDMELGGDLFDVTEFLTGMEKRQTRMEKAMRQSRAENAALRQLCTTILQTQVATTAPMAKAVQELLSKLGEIPEVPMHLGVPNARSLSRVVPIRQTRTGGFLAGTIDSRSEKQLLAKGLSNRVISEAQLRHYNHTGTFEPDEKAHARIVKDFETLAAS